MPVLTNLTTGTVLAERAEVAGSLLQRIVGLLGRRSFSEGEALIFPRCSSIHTCFMRFAIDVIFLRQGAAFRLMERVHPWRMLRAAGAEPVFQVQRCAAVMTPGKAQNGLTDSRRFGYTLIVRAKRVTRWSIEDILDSSHPKKANPR